MLGPEIICYIKSQSNYFCEPMKFIFSLIITKVRLTRSDFTERHCGNTIMVTSLLVSDSVTLRHMQRSLAFSSKGVEL